MTIDQKRLRECVAAVGGTVGIYHEDLTDHTTYQLNAEEPFPAASVIKVHILWELFRAADAGELSLTDTVTLTPEMKTPGSGVLQHLAPGLKISLRDLATLMIVISDNTATDMVVSRLSIPKINTTMRQLGLTGTVVRTDMKGTDGSNVTTPADCGKLLAAIWRGGVLSQRAHTDMMDVILRQDSRIIIPRFMSPQTRVAHKTGKIPTVRHDVGIVLHDKHPYILALMSKDIGPIEVMHDRCVAEEKLARIAQCFEPPSPS